MKNLFSLLILSSIVISSQAQWELQNSNTTSNLNSFYFLDINSGYAVGDSGIILKTIDGGSNWLEQNSGTIHELNSVHFLDLLTGFCVGNTGTIIKTIDGGMNWIITTLDPSSKLTSVQFTTNSLGYVVGYKPGNGTSWDAIVYRTVDGGSNWDINFTTSGFLESLSFPSIDTGYAVGRRSGQGVPAMMIRTTNGGSNWSVVEYNQLSAGFYSVFFTEDNLGYCAGSSWPAGTENPLLFKTENGGITWTEVSLGHFGIGSIHFITSNIGYGVGRNIWGGDGTILNFTNGGQNWYCQDSTLASGLLDVHFPIKDTGYIVGRNGIILKTTNGGGLTVGVDDLVSEFNSLTIIPNPIFTTCTFNFFSEGSFSIYNNNGQRILQLEISEQNKTIDFRDLKPGVYFCVLKTNEGIQTRKMIKL